MSYYSFMVWPRLLKYVCYKYCYARNIPIKCRIGKAITSNCLLVEIRF